MDTIFVGIFLSFVVSAFSPWLEKKLGYDTEKAKIAIILVLSFVLSIVVYVTPEQYVQSAMTILGSATSTYWILWKLISNKDQIEENIKYLTQE